MSNIDSDPWFSRGQTLGVSSTNDGTHIVGTEKVFVDVHPRTGVVNSNAPVKCVAMRNTSAGAITPGTVIKAKASALLSEVDGSAGVDDLIVGVADEYLPAAGVAVNDIFWMVVTGPSTANTAASLAAGDRISFTAGAVVAHVANKTGGVVLAAPASGKVRILIGFDARSARASSP
jgi:hypothetical protein